MIRNYYIGIGGTGARLAEALIHLCAAGLGPRNLTVMLVDPDQGNGNLARTQALATAYADAAKSFKDRAGDDVDLFATELTLPKPFVWYVFDRRGVTLGDHINLASLDGRHPELAGFARALFSHDELTTRLDEGFRGHPNIGAAVLSDVPSDREPWQTFWADVERAQAEGEVQVFLAGSIFGGTGAAGIPTFGAREVLKFDPRASLGGRSKIRLGAALVLPYFTFASGVPADGQQMFVTSADFPIATRAALSYYADKELAFDDVYLLGDSLGQNVGGFSPGNQNQENAPHYIELAGALAALDFFESTPTGSAQYFHAARSSDRIGWDDLPVTRETDQIQARLNRLKEQIATLTTFAYTYLGYGMPVLTAPPEQLDDPWHVEHFYPKKIFGRDKGKDPRPQRQVLDVVGKYLQQFVAWAAALDQGATGGVLLFDAERLQQATNGAEPAANSATIGTLLRSTSKGQDFTAFKNVLNATDVRGKPTEDVSNTDRWVNLFHRASRQFARDNYVLQGTNSAGAS
jgi:hypothetical protein